MGRRGTTRFVEIVPEPRRRSWKPVACVLALAAIVVVLALTPDPGTTLAVITLVASGLVGVALLATLPVEQVIDIRDKTPARPPVLRSQVLFAQQEPGRITVDGAVLDVEGDRSAGPAPGTPFSLDLRPPTTAWFSASIGDLLAQWAERGDVVDLELVDDARGPRVRLSKAEARVVLDLVGAAGLPRRRAQAA